MTSRWGLRTKTLKQTRQWENSNVSYLHFLPFSQNLSNSKFDIFTLNLEWFFSRDEIQRERLIFTRNKKFWCRSELKFRWSRKARKVALTLEEIFLAIFKVKSFVCFWRAASTRKSIIVDDPREKEERVWKKRCITTPNQSKLHKYANIWCKTKLLGIFHGTWSWVLHSLTFNSRSAISWPTWVVCGRVKLWHETPWCQKQKYHEQQQQVFIERGIFPMRFESLVKKRYSTVSVMMVTSGSLFRISCQLS